MTPLDATALTVWVIVWVIVAFFCYKEYKASGDDIALVGARASVALGLLPALVISLLLFYTWVLT